MLSFTKLKEGHLKKVLEWRVKPEVARYLFSNVEFDLDKQSQWFKRISQDDTYRYWLILYGDIPIGVFNLASIDQVNLRCSAGYYIGEMDYRQIGAMVPPYVYNYVFKNMKFNKVYGEVIAENKNVIQMHSMHGFRQVGVYRDHIFKSGTFYDVILIELLACDWLKQKKFQSYIADFD